MASSAVSPPPGTLVLWDTETTGLNTKTARIAELAAHRADDKGEPFVSLVHNANMPVEASAIHGLTTERLKDAPMFEVMLFRFLAWLAALPSGPVFLAAHNCPYDRDILLRQCREHGIAFPCERVLFVDTLRLFRRLLPSHTTGFSLAKLHAQWVPVAPEGAVVQDHRALGDVRMLRDVIRHCPVGELQVCNALMSV